MGSLPEAMEIITADLQSTYESQKSRVSPSLKKKMESLIEIVGATKEQVMQDGAPSDLLSIDKQANRLIPLHDALRLVKDVALEEREDIPKPPKTSQADKDRSAALLNISGKITQYQNQLKTAGFTDPIAGPQVLGMRVYAQTALQDAARTQVRLGGKNNEVDVSEVYFIVESLTMPGDFMRADTSILNKAVENAVSQAQDNIKKNPNDPKTLKANAKLINTLREVKKNMYDELKRKGYEILPAESEALSLNTRKEALEYILAMTDEKSKEVTIQGQRYDNLGMLGARAFESKKFTDEFKEGLGKINLAALEISSGVKDTPENFKIITDTLDTLRLKAKNMENLGGTPKDVEAGQRFLKETQEMQKAVEQIRDGKLSKALPGMDDVRLAGDCNMHDVCVPSLPGGSGGRFRA